MLTCSTLSVLGWKTRATHVQCLVLYCFILVQGQPQLEQLLPARLSRDSDPAHKSAQCLTSIGYIFNKRLKS